MKRQYMKPSMRVVKIQQQRIICTSLQMYSGDGNQIDDENDVW